jgi:hypothetical protein
MKKVICLISIIALISCEPPKPCTWSYKEGDVVYMKLDSTKVIIIDRIQENSCRCKCNTYLVKQKLFSGLTTEKEVKGIEFITPINSTETN